MNYLIKEVFKYINCNLKIRESAINNIANKVVGKDSNRVIYLCILLQLHSFLLLLPLVNLQQHMFLHPHL